MKDALLIIRDQLTMGYKLSFAEAMLLQQAIDVAVNHVGDSAEKVEPVSEPCKLGSDLADAVNRLLNSDGSRGTFSAVQRYDALQEVERLLAAAPTPTK